MLFYLFLIAFNIFKLSENALNIDEYIFIENNNEKVLIDCKEYNSFHKVVGEKEELLISFEEIESKLIKKDIKNIIVSDQIVSLINFKEEIYGTYKCKNDTQIRKYILAKTTLKEITSITDGFSIIKASGTTNEIFMNGAKCENSDCIVADNSNIVMYIGDNAATKYIFTNKDSLLKIYNAPLDVQGLCDKEEKFLIEKENELCNNEVSNTENCKKIGVGFADGKVSFNKAGSFSYKCAAQSYQRTLKLFKGCENGKVLDYSSKECVASTENEETFVYGFKKANLLIELEIKLYVGEKECRKRSCEEDGVYIEEKKIKDSKYNLVTIMKSVILKSIVEKEKKTFIFYNVEIVTRNNADISKIQCTGTMKTPSDLELENKKYKVCISKGYLQLHDTEKKQNVYELKVSSIEDFNITCAKLYIGTEKICTREDQKNCLNNNMIIYNKNNETTNSYIFKYNSFALHGIINCDGLFIKLTPKVHFFHKMVELNNPSICIIENSIHLKKARADTKILFSPMCLLENEEICRKIFINQEKKRLEILGVNIVSLICFLYSKKFLYTHSYILIGGDYKTKEESFEFSLPLDLDCSQNKEKCAITLPRTKNDYDIKCPLFNELQILYKKISNTFSFMDSLSKIDEKIQQSEGNYFFKISNFQTEDKDNTKIFCFNYDNFLINQIYIGKSTFVTIYIYPGQAEIKLICSTLNDQFNIENSAMSSCSKTNINSCSNDEYTIQINNKIVTVNILNHIISSDLFIKCYDHTDNIAFRLTRDAKKKILYENKVLDINDYCTNNNFKFIVGNKECPDVNDVAGCTAIGTFNNGKVTLVDNVDLKIKCIQTNYEIVQIFEKLCNSGFACMKICIPIDAVCNGIVDCEESKDEENCEDKIEYLIEIVPSIFEIESIDNNAELRRINMNKFYKIDKFDETDVNGIKYKKNGNEISIMSSESIIDDHLLVNSNSKILYKFIKMSKKIEIGLSSFIYITIECMKLVINKKSICNDNCFKNTKDYFISKLGNTYNIFDTKIQNLSLICLNKDKNIQFNIKEDKKKHTINQEKENQLDYSLFCNKKMTISTVYLDIIINNCTIEIERGAYNSSLCQEYMEIDFKNKHFYSKYSLVYMFTCIYPEYSFSTVLFMKCLKDQIICPNGKCIPNDADFSICFSKVIEDKGSSDKGSSNDESSNQSSSSSTTTIIIVIVIIIILLVIIGFVIYKKKKRNN